MNKLLYNENAHGQGTAMLNNPVSVVRPNYDYVEISEAIAASFADSLPGRFFEEIPEFRGGHVRKRADTATERVLRDRSLRVSMAQETCERIIARFTGQNGAFHGIWTALRAENQRRHDRAASLGRWPMSHTA
jgi:hypothetical protein